MKKITIPSLLLIISSLLLAGCSFNNSTETTYELSQYSEEPKEVKVESINVNLDALKVLSGKKGQLVTTVSPERATNKELEYSVTKGGDIAYVNNQGVVTGLKAGNAEVTVKTTDGSNISKVIPVEVISQSPEVDSAFPIADYSPNYEEYLFKSNATTKGKQKILVIPIKLPESDQFYNEEDSLSWINIAYNGAKEENGGLYTLREYFLNASLGMLDYETTVSEWYIAPEKFTTEYMRKDDGYSYVNELFPLAFQWYKDTHKNIDFSLFDNDRDGYIDNIHFMPNQSYPARAYRSIIVDDTVTTSGLKLLDFVYCPYAYYNHENTHDNPKGGVNSRVNVHENGHMLGLTDYYDTSATYSFTGQFDMQDHNVMDWNVFSKYSVGWIKPRYVDEDYLKANKTATITLSSSGLDSDCLILRNKDWMGHAFDEYIMLELFNRDTPNNYFDCRFYSDTNTRSLRYGVKIFHIDARVVRSFYNEEFGMKTSEIITKNSPSRQTITNCELMNNNTRYPGFREKDEEKDMLFHLIHLLQKQGTSTFEEAKTKYKEPRHYLTNNDLWRTGDTFTIAPHEGYKDYGENFFIKKTTLNDDSDFPYGLVFDEVTPNTATITVNYLD